MSKPITEHQRYSKVIHIPFRDNMKQSILNGLKTCTSRNKKYGEVGDIFSVGDYEYLLTAVYQQPLGIIAEALYRLEGFDSPESFKIAWAEIHPRKGFDPKQMVWLHEFKRL